MNEEQIYGYMDELLHQIPTFIKNESILKKHLLFMRFFADYEWFNIASILYVYPNASNVKTTEAWTKTFAKQIYPKKGQKGIPIMLPLFDTEKMLHWKFVKVFDISQLATTIKPVFISPLKSEIDKYGTNKIKEEYGQQWYVDFLQKGISEHYFMKEHPELNSFLYNCCLFAFEDILNIPNDEPINFTIEQDDELDYIGLYKCMKDVCSLLPEKFKQLNYKATEREKEKEEIQMVAEFTKMNIKQIKAKAMEIVNDRLQHQTDSEGIQELQNEGIPNVDVSEYMVYQGEDDI